MCKEAILKKIYQISPFNLKGDLTESLPPLKENFISCLLCATRKPELEQLLSELSQQTLPKDQFELIVLDNSLNGLNSLTEKYSRLFFIVYMCNTSPDGLIGDFRNKTIQKARGEFVVFLDDDTRLPQKDFLEKALKIFKESAPDVILPYGQALAGEHQNYQFLDSYSFAARCCLYRKSILEALGGFHNDLSAYEDIDLGIRFSLNGRRILKTNLLRYQHPSLLFNTMKKPFAIGQSIFKLRCHYPWHLWLLIYIHALRFLPLGLIPTTRNRQWFKISLGVLLAPFIQKKFTYPR